MSDDLTITLLKKINDCISTVTKDMSMVPVNVVKILIVLSVTLKVTFSGDWNIESVHRFTDSLTVTTSKSNKTGLTIVVANTESPVVNGFFCLATEAENNWGLPHTLEHLIFMGSRHYPYKDVLDLLGNRCLADR